MMIDSDDPQFTNTNRVNNHTPP